MPRPPQTYANHRVSRPMYYWGLSAILLLNVLFGLYQLFRELSVEHAVDLLLALGLFIVFYYLRVWPLIVQDRLIRLEMRLRLERVLRPPLSERIGELTLGQLVALRFAGDEEQPALCQEVLEKGIKDREEIKRRIRSWQADHLRV